MRKFFILWIPAFAGMTTIVFSSILFAEPICSNKTPTILLVKKIPFSLDGKKENVFRIEQPDGSWGYHGVKGQCFDVIVKNQTDEPTVLHWHGLIMPNEQDGVAGVTQDPIPPGEQYHYQFLLKQSGTYWMHSHFELQEQQLLSAPLIISDPKETPVNKNVVMFLSEFSHTPPQEIFKHLQKGMQEEDMSDMDMRDMPPDLVDVQYDHLLTNYHILKDPQIVRVKEGDLVRLRIIAGSAMTNFLIQLPIEARAIAIDGEAIAPHTGKHFELAAGQRIDLLVRIPKGQGSYPILAQGEGTQLQTGLILATTKAKIIFPKEALDSAVGALTNHQEQDFKTLHPLADKKPDEKLTVNLEGDMMKYEWKINGEAWPKITPLELHENQRVEMTFNNTTNMAHPMHLHGHVFEVTALNGKPLERGLLHDTVLVRAHESVTVQFDADNPGHWPLHCHMLYHMMSGMMTLVNY